MKDPRSIPALTLTALLVVIMTGPDIFPAGAGSRITGKVLPVPADSLVWSPVDSFSGTVLLRAGDRAVFEVDTSVPSLTETFPDTGLTPRALEALDRAPDWPGTDLQLSFSRMGGETQDYLSDIILTAEDLLVDEIAFQIAHLPCEILQADSFYTQVLVENAEGIYAADSLLDYVNIIENRKSGRGGEYWTTVEYFIVESGDTIDLELPRDYYYWYVLMPRVTREFPGYIDPSTGGVTDPPAGVFWRDYLFAGADDGYPILADRLAGVETLWNSGVESIGKVKIYPPSSISVLPE